MYRMISVHKNYTLILNKKKYPKRANICTKLYQYIFAHKKRITMRRPHYAVCRFAFTALVLPVALQGSPRQNNSFHTV